MALSKSGLTKELFNRIIEHYPFGLMIIQHEDPFDDKSYRIIKVNKTSEQINGLLAKDIEGKTMYEVFPAIYKKYPFYVEGYKKAIEGETVDLGEIEYGDKKINSNIFHVKFIPLENKYFMISYENITGQKKQEELILNSNKQLSNQNQELESAHKNLSDYKLALDESALVAITDTKGTITYVNNMFCKVSQYPKEELMGNNHRIINSGYHPISFFKEMWKTIANGKVWKGEIKNRSKVGTYYWVSTTIVPFMDENNKPYQYLAIRHDITRQKEFQTQLLGLNNSLSQNNIQLNEVIKDLSDYKFAIDEAALVAITDVKGTITYVNEMFCKVSQYPKEELMGNNHRIINSGFHPTSFFREMWKTIANGKVWKGEIKNKSKIGTYYWVSTTIVPFMDENNKPYQYLAIRHDITDRKTLEQKIINSIIISQEENREYIAEDIHEGLAQTLTGVSMQITAVEDRIKGLNDKQLISSVNFIKQYVLQSIKNSRKLSQDLMPRTMMASGIISSLSSFFNDLNESSSIPIEFKSESFNESINKNIEITLYRTITAIINQIIPNKNINKVDISLIKSDELNANINIYCKVNKSILTKDEIMMYKYRILLQDGRFEITKTKKKFSIVIIF